MKTLRDNSIEYRPEIDGLRALAVVPVLLYHAHLGASGGFVGVDVFFVISGFLITAMLRKRMEAAPMDLLDFWERRVRRIFPALAVMTLTTLVVGWFLLLPADYKELGESVCAQTLLFSNVFFWRHTNYFDGAADLKPLLHTWSLAVEEQFYLLRKKANARREQNRPSAPRFGVELWTSTAPKHYKYTSVFSIDRKIATFIE